MAKANGDQLIGTVEEWFAKLPPLPKNWTDVIVKIVPWIALIFGILGVLGGLAAVGIFTAVSPALVMGNGFYSTTTGLIGAVLALVSSALLLAAFPGTRDNKMSGWKLLFWSEAVSILSSVLAISVSGVIVGLIGLYILFQIKKYYK